jgi:hypothetical protein
MEQGRSYVFSGLWGISLCIETQGNALLRANPTGFEDLAPAWQLCDVRWVEFFWGGGLVCFLLGVFAKTGVWMWFLGGEFVVESW